MFAEPIITEIVVDASLAAKFDDQHEAVILRSPEGRLLGMFRPVREGTPADYAKAIDLFTEEEIDQARASGIGRPLAEILADLQVRRDRL